MITVRKLTGSGYVVTDSTIRSHAGPIENAAASIAMALSLVADALGYSVTNLEVAPKASPPPRLQTDITKPGPAFDPPEVVEAKREALEALSGDVLALNVDTDERKPEGMDHGP